MIAIAHDRLPRERVQWHVIRGLHLLSAQVDLIVVGADSEDVRDAWAPSMAADCSDAIPVKQIKVAAHSDCSPDQRF